MPRQSKIMIELEKEKKEITTKFFVLLGLIVLVTVIGIFLLFKASEVPTVGVKKRGKDLESFLPIILREGIAIINVEGVIQFGSSRSLFGIREYGASVIVSRIKKYSEIDKVKGIVLRINSPGGTIGAVQEIYRELIKFRAKGKIVVASMGDIAASGGYYIASAADEIVANPGTITGSIGVIIAAPSFVNLFNKIGISYRVFKSGKYKDILSPYREISSEEKALIQSVVDDAYEQFFNAVKIGRNLPERKLKRYADGRIFTGRQAKKLGFVDELGGLQDAIKLAGKLTGLGENPYIIKERVSPWQQFFGLLHQEKKTLTEKLFNTTYNSVPVYYLYQP